MLLLMLLLALSSTNSRRRTFSAHYISEYINMRGKKSALENSVSKPEKSKYWSVWCWGKRRRDFFLRSIGIRSRWLVWWLRAGGTARCVLNWRRILHMHMFKSTAVLLAWVHIYTPSLLGSWEMICMRNINMCASSFTHYTPQTIQLKKPLSKKSSKTRFCHHPCQVLWNETACFDCSY